MREGTMGPGSASKGRGRLVGVLLSAWVAALSLPGIAGAQAPNADGLFGAARGALQEALGGRLDMAPQFRAGEATDLRQPADAELAAQVGWQFPDLQGPRRAEAVAAAAEALRGVSLVLPASDGATFLVFPETARQLAQRDARLARVAAPEALQLALVYAVARAALERRYALAGRWAACRDNEEFLSLQAVLEGRALAVTRQVARRLGTESFFPLLGECYLHAADSTPDPLLRLVSQEAVRQRQRAGMRGLAFFDYLEAQGMRDAEARAFARPPRLRDWVVHPELYVRALQDSRPALADTLKGVEATLSGPGWQPLQEPWTPVMLRQTAALFGEQERAERLAGRWLEGRSLVWNAPHDPGRQVAVGVIRFLDGDGARAYFGFAADLQRKQDEALGKATGGACRVLESRADRLTVRGADEAASTTKRLQFAPETPPLTVTQFWLRRGDTVVQLSWTGMPPDASWAGRVLDAVSEGTR